MGHISNAISTRLLKKTNIHWAAEFKKRYISYTMLDQITIRFINSFVNSYTLVLTRNRRNKGEETKNVSANSYFLANPLIEMDILFISCKVARSTKFLIEISFLDSFLQAYTYEESKAYHLTGRIFHNPKKVSRKPVFLSAIPRETAEQFKLDLGRFQLNIAKREQQGKSNYISISQRKFWRRKVCNMRRVLRSRTEKFIKIAKFYRTKNKKPHYKKLVTKNKLISLNSGINSSPVKRTLFLLKKKKSFSAKWKKIEKYITGFINYKKDVTAKVQVKKKPVKKIVKTKLKKKKIVLKQKTKVQPMPKTIKTKTSTIKKKVVKPHYSFFQNLSYKKYFKRIKEGAMRKNVKKGGPHYELYELLGLTKVKEKIIVDTDKDIKKKRRNKNKKNKVEEKIEPIVKNTHVEIQCKAEDPLIVAVKRKKAVTKTKVKSTLKKKHKKLKIKRNTKWFKTRKLILRTKRTFQPSTSLVINKSMVKTNKRCKRILLLVSLIFLFAAEKLNISKISAKPIYARIGTGKFLKTKFSNFTINTKDDNKKALLNQFINMYETPYTMDSLAMEKRIILNKTQFLMTFFIVLFYKLKTKKKLTKKRSRRLYKFARKGIRKTILQKKSLIRQLIHLLKIHQMGRFVSKNIFNMKTVNKKKNIIKIKKSHRDSFRNLNRLTGKKQIAKFNSFIPFNSALLEYNKILRSPKKKKIMKSHITRIDRQVLYRFKQSLKIRKNNKNPSFGKNRYNRYNNYKQANQYNNYRGNNRRYNRNKYNKMNQYNRYNNYNPITQYNKTNNATTTNRYTPRTSNHTPRTSNAQYNKMNQYKYTPRRQYHTGTKQTNAYEKKTYKYNTKTYPTKNQYTKQNNNMNKNPYMKNRQTSKITNNNNTKGTKPYVRYQNMTKNRMGNNSSNQYNKFNTVKQYKSNYNPRFAKNQYNRSPYYNKSNRFNYNERYNRNNRFGRYNRYNNKRNKYNLRNNRGLRIKKTKYDKITSFKKILTFRSYKKSIYARRKHKKTLFLKRYNRVQLGMYPLSVFDFLLQNDHIPLFTSKFKNLKLLKVLILLMPYIFKTNNLFFLFIIRQAIIFIYKSQISFSKRFLKLFFFFELKISSASASITFNKKLNDTRKYLFTLMGTSIYATLPSFDKNTKNTIISFLGHHTKNITPELINNYLVHKLGQYFQISEIVRPIIRDLTKSNNAIAGFKIIIAGRPTRKERASYFIRKRGKMSLVNFSNPILYGTATKIMKFGLVGIKTWLFKKGNAKPFYYNLKLIFALGVFNTNLLKTKEKCDTL